MNIFIVGNGFDLAHGLPTTYSDFLEFLFIVDKHSKNYEFFQQTLNNTYKISKNNIFKQILDAFFNENSENYQKQFYQELTQLTSQTNLWIDYFLDIRNKMHGKNWIDLESVIANAIQWVDLSLQIVSDCSSSSDLYPVPLKELVDQKVQIHRFTEDDKDKYIHLLETDLNNFTRCLELYLLFTRLISTSKIFNKLIPPTKSGSRKKYNSNNTTQTNELISIDAILNFNYTDFLQRLYCNNISKKRICHIHGKLEHKNIILGIDEYLSNEDRSRNVKCIRFKKYFQRILKETDNNFVHWLNTKGEHHLHIIGHSLDVTDHDILRKLITKDCVTTTIYYHNEEAHAKLIANMVIMLDQENVVTRVNHGRLIFKNQEILY